MNMRLLSSSRWTALLLVGVLVIILFAGQPVSSAQPDQMGFFGLNTYITGLERNLNDGPDGIAHLVNLGREAGAGWSREELSWANMEPGTKGIFTWGHYDTRILQLAEAGYGIVGMLLTTPEWARKGECVGSYWCPPANPQDYADFVRAIVERYDGDGHDDAPGSPRVAAWQIWNEPNYQETWPGSPEEYGRLLVAGYTAAKASDPTAVVATGGIYVYDGSHGISFLGNALDAVPEAYQSFDVLAIHPFMPDVPPDHTHVPGNPHMPQIITMWGRIWNTRNWMGQRGFGDRPLWITEVGWTTCNPDRGYCSDEVRKDEQQQANYLVRTHAIALALGVQHLSTFQLEDKFDGEAGNYWQEMGIVDTRGNGYRKKAAYTAYQVMADLLAGAAFEGFGPANTYTFNEGNPYGANPEARYHLRFRRPDGALVDVLWRNRGTEQVTVPLEPGLQAEVITRDGQHTPAAGSVALVVGEEPVYVHQAASLIPPASIQLYLPFVSR
jgi:hypothetical protein